MAPDLSLLRTISKENLGFSLRLLRGKKILIIEPKLIPILDLIANFQFLKDHGVEKVVHLTTQPPAVTEISQHLYFISSDLISAKLVCDQINSNLGRGLQVTYGLIAVPRLLQIIKSLFEYEGVYGHVTFGQYAYEFIPLDDHIISLQYDDIVQSLWLHNETSYLAAVAKAIFNIRGIYGDFHHMIAIGSYSQNVSRMIHEYERIYSQSLKSHNRFESDIPTMIIIDRSQDFVSPLLTPLTYEAMLDEVYGINGKSIVFGPEITGKDSFKQILSSTDTIFGTIRNLHISKVIPRLVKIADELKQEKLKSASVNLKTVKKFVEKDLNHIISKQKSLTLHFSAVESIIKERSIDIKRQIELEDKIFDNISTKEVNSYLEDAMARGFNPTIILRLFSLITLSQDGLRDFQSLKTQFIQSYGFKEMITLHNMETMGILYPSKGLDIEGSVKSVSQIVNKVYGSMSPGDAGNSKDMKKSPVPFQMIMKKLVPPANVVINSEADPHKSTHPSYVYNGKIVPFVAKIVEEIIRILSSPGSNTPLIEKKLDDLMKFYHVNESAIKCKPHESGSPYGRGRNVLVFVLGGICRGEIAALQNVGFNTGFNIICAGTDITNGKKIVNAAMC